MYDDVVSDVRKVLDFAANEGHIDNWGDAGLTSLCSHAWEAKGQLRDLLSKHPNWNEKRQAIVLDFNEMRNCDATAAINVVKEIIRLGPQKDGENKYKYFMYYFADYIENNDITEAFIEYLKYNYKQEVDEFRIRVGQKVNKVFRKILDAYIGEFVDEEVNSEVKKYFERKYAEFSDYMKPVSIKRKLLLSINPADFLTMSQGVSWSSCHYFDGCHAAGTTSYALDKVSMILFTVTEDSNLDVLDGKINRQIYCYADHQILQSRLYPNYNDNNRTIEFRHIVEEIFCELTGDPNLWFLYKNKNKYNISNMSDLHYPDYYYSDYNTRFCVNKKYINESLERLQIGSDGCCLLCGDTLNASDSLLCDECKVEERYCEYCGEYHPEWEMSHVIYNDCWGWICQEHIDIGYVIQCDECGDYYSEDRIVCSDNGECYCKGCAEDIWFICDDCGEYHDKCNLNKVVDKFGEEHSVCDDCLDYYEQCSVCGTYFKELTSYGCCPHCGAVIDEYGAVIDEEESE